MSLTPGAALGSAARVKTADFDFDLPEDRIALRPASPRDSAKLLVVRGAGAFEDRIVRELPGLLQPGDALVLNDTRVLPVQLSGLAGAARIGATLISRVDERRWWSFVRNARRLAPGDCVAFGAELSGEVEAKRESDGAVLWRFTCDGPLEAALERAGAMPLPPYIASRRAPDVQDAADYQTVYAAKSGSVAAPTAGLHFTPELLSALDARGVERVTLTLHVGPGTFLPVKAEDVSDHRMHAEWGEVSPDAAARLNAVRARGGRVIAVGTTSLRLLESAADERRVIHPFAAETAIFITPGHVFRGIDGLMTNFHLPKSTLFMLVSALMGVDRMRAAYAHAIDKHYRFYSYGDSSLLLP